MESIALFVTVIASIFAIIAYYKSSVKKPKEDKQYLLEQLDFPPLLVLSPTTIQGFSCDILLKLCRVCNNH